MNVAKAIAASLLIGLLGCEQVIDIKPSSDFSGTLVIEGLLVAEEYPEIYLNKAVPFFQENVTPQQVFARGAKVTILESNEAEILTADSTFDQFRCRWVPYYKGKRKAQFGKTYDLVVEFNGRTYTASTTIDQAKPTIQQITYTPEFYDIYGGHDGVNIILADPIGAGDFYRFQMNRRIDNTRAHAHILDVIQSTCTSGEKFWVTDLGRTIYSDEGNDGQELDLLIEVSFEYLEGDSAWVSMQSLDDRSAAFYKELDDQLVSILNPFVEPVFLKSQIEGGAIGYFGSAVLSDSVLFIYPQDNP